MIESVRLDDLRDVIRPSDTVVLALELAILVLLLPAAAAGRGVKHSPRLTAVRRGAENFIHFACAARRFFAR